MLESYSSRRREDNSEVDVVVVVVVAVVATDKDADEEIGGTGFVVLLLSVGGLAGSDCGVADFSKPNALK